MKEAFKDFGTIVNSDVYLDDRGRSKGYGVVLFTTREAAEDAIQTMN